MTARFMPVIILFILTLVFGWLLTTPEHAPSADDAVRPLPTVMLPQLDDSKPRAIKPGGWRLINFFASWCVPCAVEHPNLMELKDTLPITGIAYKDTTVMVKTLLQQRGNPYAQVLMDTDGKASIPFGIAGVPESFLVNPQGQIVWHYAGPVLNTQMNEIKDLVDGK